MKIWDMFMIGMIAVGVMLLASESFALTLQATL